MHYSFAKYSIMYGIDYSNRNIGVNFNSAGKAEIVVWCPLLSNVQLVTESNIQIPLVRNRFGYWKAVTDLVKPGDNYKYLLNDKNVFPDPASASQPLGPHGYSQAIELTQYVWDDQA